MEIDIKELEESAKKEQKEGEDYDEALLRVCKQKYDKDWKIIFDMVKQTREELEDISKEKKYYGSYQSISVSCKHCKTMNDSERTSCIKCGKEQSFKDIAEKIKENYGQEIIFLNSKQKVLQKGFKKTLFLHLPDKEKECPSCGSKTKEKVCQSCGTKINKGILGALKDWLGFR